MQLALTFLSSSQNFAYIFPAPPKRAKIQMFLTPLLTSLGLSFFKSLQLYPKVKLKITLSKAEQIHKTITILTQDKDFFQT